MSDTDDGKSPFEHLLDLCVYAPLGFALEARTLLPKFVDRGRNQVVLARVVGKYAVRKSTRATEERVARAQDQFKAVLRTVGIASDGSEASSNGAGRTPDAEADPVRPAPEASGAPGPSADHLAIPDYDALSASQVVPRLESLTADELEAVRDYESATRGRKTILNKIAQLQSS